MELLLKQRMQMHGNLGLITEIVWSQGIPLYVVQLIIFTC